MSSCSDITNQVKIEVQPFQAARSVIMSLLPQLPQAGSPDIHTKCKPEEPELKKKKKNQPNQGGS